MADENQKDVGTDIIQFHRIITRSLEIVRVNKGNYFGVKQTLIKN